MSDEPSRLSLIKEELREVVYQGKPKKFVWGYYACECGNKIWIKKKKVDDKKTRSCGCMRRKNTKGSVSGKRL